MSPPEPDRIVVIGTSGSGKSTVARRIGDRLGMPVVELDALHHLPGWEPRPVEEFRGLVAEAIAGHRWVVDGNYTIVRDLVWPRTQTVLWLDYPRRIVMSRVVRRSLRRVVTRQELWHGLYERWGNLLSLEPEKSIIVWAWTTYHDRRRRYLAATEDPAWDHIQFVRLGHPRQADRLISGLTG